LPKCGEADAQFVQPYMRRIFTSLGSTGVPMIHFGVATSTLLEAMATDGASVIGLDWRVPLDEGWSRIGHDLAVQGNLDPVALFAPPDVLEAKAADVLQRAGGRPGHSSTWVTGSCPGRRSTTPSGSPSSCATRARGCTRIAGRSPSPPNDRMPTAPTGILLLAYGSPETPDDVEPYFRHIRGGRAPSPEAVAGLRRRYELIGGRTPLSSIDRNRQALQAALDVRAPARIGRYVAMKHWHPFIGDVIPRIAADGFRRVVAIVLARTTSA
jgi:hypothetical protein